MTAKLQGSGTLKKQHRKWDCPCTDCQRWYRDALTAALAENKTLRNIELAARELLSKQHFVVGMRNDDPRKGGGNRLADALLAYDAAMLERKP